MSTNINITVGGNALLDVAKQQQAANRQAQLNREASNRLEAQATAARTTALAAQGRDDNGNLITGALFTQPLIDRRPVANRAGEEFFLLRPIAGPTDGAIPLISNKLPKEIFTGNPVTFSATAGPSGSPALQAIAPVDGFNYVSLTNVLPATPVSKYANRPLTDYTLQLFVRLGETYVTNQRDVNFDLRLKGVSVVNDINYTFDIYMFANLDTTAGDSYPASSFEFSESSNFAGTTVIYEGNAVNLASSNPKVAPGIWNHLAISKKDTVLYAFLNGQLLATAFSTLPASSFLRPTAGFFTELSFGQTQERTLPGQTVSIHGLRFDTKCLYTANFTPPPSL